MSDKKVIPLLIFITVLGKGRTKWSQGCKLCRNLTPIGGIMIYTKSEKLTTLISLLTSK